MCLRDNMGWNGDFGERIPVASERSVGPAQALKTTSRMPGVNSDSVRWEFVSAARRRRFFSEKRECVSALESSDKDAICAASRAFPKQSTGSWGGLARGSVICSSSGGCFAFCASSSSSRALYSGTHNLSDSRWMIAGTSSISRVLSCPSISFCR